MEQQTVINAVGDRAIQDLPPHGEFLRIAKIVQVSAMKVHFQIAERSLFYLNPYIHLRRMTYPPERGKWIGGKMGFVSIEPEAKTDRGWIDIDWFRVTLK